MVRRWLSGWGGVGGERLSDEGLVGAEHPHPAINYKKPTSQGGSGADGLEPFLAQREAGDAWPFLLCDEWCILRCVAP